MTLNEPWTYAVNAYAEGAFAPGRCSAWMERNCTGGDSGTEPYLVAHNFLLAHAAAVKLYRYKYQVLIIFYGHTIGSTFKILCDTLLSYN